MRNAVNFVFQKITQSCFKFGKTATKTHDMLKLTSEEETMIGTHTL